MKRCIDGIYNAQSMEASNGDLDPCWKRAIASRAAAKFARQQRQLQVAGVAPQVSLQHEPLPARTLARYGPARRSSERTTMNHGFSFASSSSILRACWLSGASSSTFW